MWRVVARPAANHVPTVRAYTCHMTRPFLEPPWPPPNRTARIASALYGTHSMTAPSARAYHSMHPTWQAVALGAGPNVPVGQLLQLPEASTTLPAGQGVHAAGEMEPAGAVCPGGQAWQDNAAVALLYVLMEHG